MDPGYLITDSNRDLQGQKKFRWILKENSIITSIRSDNRCLQ